MFRQPILQIVAADVGASLDVAEIIGLTIKIETFLLIHTATGEEHDEPRQFPKGSGLGQGSAGGEQLMRRQLLSCGRYDFLNVVGRHGREFRILRRIVRQRGERPQWFSFRA